ncbi:hypothetical protein [Solitalea lacus]|uniref:hypothetical protein n=1 Tax=Solitalea lacus TaxID=2911172 RepID=UPI001EDB7D26|nr:hypothetical protein [Solitalea lacus]UKJ07462.1 hypothetical protein L2B55_18315 [Solitalea lacus]
MKKILLLIPFLFLCINVCAQDSLSISEAKDWYVKYTNKDFRFLKAINTGSWTPVIKWEDSQIIKSENVPIVKIPFTSVYPVSSVNILKDEEFLLIIKNNEIFDCLFASIHKNEKFKVNTIKVTDLRKGLFYYKSFPDTLDLPSWKWYFNLKRERGAN